MELCPPGRPSVLSSKPQLGIELKSSQVPTWGPAVHECREGSLLTWNTALFLLASSVLRSQVCISLNHEASSCDVSSYSTPFTHRSWTECLAKPFIMLGFCRTLMLCRLSGCSTVAQGEKTTDLVFHLLPLSSMSLLPMLLILSFLTEILCQTYLAHMQVINKFR